MRSSLLRACSRASRVVESSIEQCTSWLAAAAVAVEQELLGLSSGLQLGLQRASGSRRRRPPPPAPLLLAAPSFATSGIVHAQVAWPAGPGSDWLQQQQQQQQQLQPWQQAHVLLMSKIRNKTARHTELEEFEAELLVDEFDLEGFDDFEEYEEFEFDEWDDFGDDEMEEMEAEAAGLAAAAAGSDDNGGDGGKGSSAAGGKNRGQTGAGAGKRR